MLEFTYHNYFLRPVSGAQVRRDYHIPYFLPTVLRVIRKAGFARPDRRGA